MPVQIEEDGTAERLKKLKFDEMTERKVPRKFLKSIAMEKKQFRITGQCMLTACCERNSEEEIKCRIFVRRAQVAAEIVSLEIDDKVHISASQIKLSPTTRQAFCEVPSLKKKVNLMKGMVNLNQYGKLPVREREGQIQVGEFLLSL